MRVTPETVAAYHAVRALQVLYDAYCATSRANVLVVDRLAAGIDSSDRFSADKRARDSIAAAERAALSRRNEKVYSVRRDQLRRRRLELLGLEELP